MTYREHDPALAEAVVRGDVVAEDEPGCEDCDKAEDEEQNQVCEHDPVQFQDGAFSGPIQDILVAVLVVDIVVCAGCRRWCLHVHVVTASTHLLTQHVKTDCLYGASDSRRSTLQLLRKGE